MTVNAGLSCDRRNEAEPETLPDQTRGLCVCESAEERAEGEKASGEQRQCTRFGSGSAGVGYAIASHVRVAQYLAESDRSLANKAMQGEVTLEVDATEVVARRCHVFHTVQETACKDGSVLER